MTKPVDPPKPPDLGHGVARGLERDTYHMWMTENVRTVCKGPVPYFDFDSAETATSQQPTMQTLSTCMIEGPLKGKTIRLIGHTDPRGTENYNDKLGLERAERVKRYLVSHGVEPARVVVETAGEDRASDAPSDWPKNRRVEIQLAK